jgi:hypothetical protein
MSNSKLPNGGFSLTNGSNYMLDGFHFDTEYGNGVYEKARLPEAKGLATLPSGMIPPDSPITSDLPTGVEVDLDLDLSDLTKDASEQLIPLVDHSWLASNPQENLEGMRSHEEVLEHFAEGRFEHPQVNQMKTLEESWADGSTTGLEILPNTHREHDKYHNSYRRNQSKLPGDDYRQKVEQGSRRVAYGNETLDEIVDSLSLDGKTASRLMSDLSDEYGLHGRVYIKEASFPGLFNGRWDEVINKRCASSMYIIPSKSDCVFDRFLGMKVVASVKDIPWKEAYHSLMPKLETYGVTKVSGSSYASMLSQAFVDVMEGRIESPVQSSTWFQVQPDHTNLISIDRAKVALEQFEADNPFIETQEQRHLSATESRLNRIAKQLVDQHLVEGEIVEEVLKSDRTASAKIDRLYEIASKPVIASSYEGQGKEAKLLNPYKSTLDPNAKVLSVTQKDKIASAKKCQEKVAKLIQQGLISISEVEEVTKTASTPEAKLASVYEFLSRPAQVQKYMGEQEAHYMTKKSTIDANAHVDNKEARNLAQRSNIAQTKIAKMIESGLISYDEVAVAIKGQKTPESKVASVFAFLAKPQKTASYNQYSVTEHRMVKSRNKPLDEVPNMEKRASANLWKEAHSKVDRLVSAGLLSQEKYDSLSGISDPNDFVRKAFDIASKPSEATEYQGSETAHFLSNKKSAQMTESEMRVATWIRQKMSEGSAGDELDVLLSTRFSQNVLQDHQSRIASLRNEHEGVSGHAYVDAEAYMTQGTEGCEKGALIHRANQIPTLLKTAKCGTCVFNSGGTCQKYNKVVVASATEIVEDKEQYQTEMIRLANASDAEQTASLFVNNYDESEFGLTQAGSNVDFSDSPTTATVGDVLFGGFEV